MSLAICCLPSHVLPAMCTTEEDCHSIAIQQQKWDMLRHLCTVGSDGLACPKGQLL